MSAGVAEYVDSAQDVSSLKCKRVLACHKLKMSHSCILPVNFRK